MNAEAALHLDHGELKARLTALKDLPTLPTVLDEVSRLVETPDANPEEIARIISLDQVLSAKVLMMVNSPIYGFPGRISSISHALVLLGFNVIRGIVVSTSVLDMMMEKHTILWDHSVATALAASIVAREAGLKEPEECSVAGLLHDLGKLIIGLQAPDMEQEVRKAMQKHDLPGLTAEREVLGLGHDRINGWLCDLWNLPPNLEEALTLHHAPGKARKYPQMAAVVHVADFAAHAVGRGGFGEPGVPYLEGIALENLGLDLGVLPNVLHQLERRLPQNGLLP